MTACARIAHVCVAQVPLTSALCDGALCCDLPHFVHPLQDALRTLSLCMDSLYKTIWPVLLLPNFTLQAIEEREKAIARGQALDTTATPSFSAVGVEDEDSILYRGFPSIVDGVRLELPPPHMSSRTNNASASSSSSSDGVKKDWKLLAYSQALLPLVDSASSSSSSATSSPSSSKSQDVS